jgi:hypothetical protein
MRIRPRIVESAEEILGRSRREFVAPTRNQSDLYVGDGDGLFAIVGDDEENRLISVPVKVIRENLRLLARVIGIGCNADLLVRVIVVRSVSLRRLSCRFYKIFGGQARGARNDNARNGGSSANPSFPCPRHDFDYRGKVESPQ